MEALMEPRNFFEISKEVVKSFIQAVVAVDDQMLFDSRPIEAVSELEEPDEEVFGVIDDSADSTALTADQENDLYYQDLSSAFANKGIVCSGFRPAGDSETIISSIVASSKNADVTILDWQMDDAQMAGTLATAAIREIIASDIKEGGRLRLITIYTADDLPTVLEALRNSLNDQGAVINEEHICFHGDILRFCKIDVISKENAELELTEKVVTSFTHLTAGLLSNAALSAITDLRNRTHNILYKFNKNLDSAYLSHVLGLISSPDMREQAHEVAFDYAVEILSEEIKSELQTSKIVKTSLSRDTLSLWPEHVNHSNSNEYFALKIGKSEPVKFGSERMSSLLTISSEEQLQQVLGERPALGIDERRPPLDVLKRENIELSVDNEAAATHHLELSAIQCVRRDLKTNGSHIPVMKQGTIVKDGQKYYVCIQPLCDSVRLRENTNFTFLRISKAKTGKPFSHVVRGNGGAEHLRLCIQPSSKRLNVFNFSPCGDAKVIKASLDQNKLIFNEVVSGRNFEWCGEFKQAVAQEIVNSVSASLARVGFDSFEWLRMKAGSQL